MASFKVGAFGAGISGTSGSTVFVRTPSGIVVRDRVVPQDPRQPAQVEARSRLRRASIAWSELDEEAVERWTAYARSLARWTRRPA